MLEALIEIVRRAGDMVLSAHDIQNVTREKHGPADLVTQYDEAVQAFLRRELLRLLPEADFFGEEGEPPPDPAWVLWWTPSTAPPTSPAAMNYSSISVALVHNGQTEYGVVLQPLCGRAVRRPAGAMGPPSTAPPFTSAATTCPMPLWCAAPPSMTGRIRTRNFSILRRLYDRCLDYRRFASAALDCCQIAAGRAEIFFECRLSPWDYAAGTLIAQEAGATATRLEGGPMDPLHAGSVFITNGVCHSVLSELQQ